MPRQDLGARALRFCVEILALNRRLRPKSERFGGALNQIVRPATGIGANVEWLRLLSSDPFVGSSVDGPIKEANEWVAMLTTTVKKPSVLCPLPSYNSLMATESLAREAIGRAATAHDAMKAAVAALKQRPDYSWVGIYLLDGNELVLGPYLGKPSPHTRIPLGRGICGAAATEKQTIIVDDVNADPRYLACSVETKSEIVTPIMLDGVVLGEIDIDSDKPAAFGKEDRKLVEAVAAMLAPRLAETA